MQQLGQTLRGLQANITFMNLTNVLPYVEVFKNTAQVVDILSTLPVTPHAPVLTTNRMNRLPRSKADEIDMRLKGMGGCQITGPFFGLGNLATTGGNIEGPAPGPITERQYAAPPASPANSPIAFDEEVGFTVISLGSLTEILDDNDPSQPPRPTSSHRATLPN